VTEGATGAPPVDSVGMWDATAQLPEQVRDAAAAAAALDGLPEGRTFRDVIVLGMGGSGIAGDVLVAAAAERLPIPAAVAKSYALPSWVGPDSLVFAVSCSGNTEETVSAAEAAWERGAAVVTVSGGGTLVALAEANGGPVVAVPPEIPQPRAAFGAMAVPPLVILERLGLFAGAGQELGRAVAQLQRRRDQLVGPKSPAEAVARRIGRTFALLHGGPGYGAVAAQRWKTQINENAKAPAFSSAQPELCHNEVVGWGQDGDVSRQVITLVTLRQPDEHPQVARRFELIAEIMREVVAGIVPVWAEGDGALARFFDLVLFGDFVSLHLAAAEGVDPGPVPILIEIKERLGSGADRPS
jgi:glucose/mannose-6-phosphate isomerase